MTKYNFGQIFEMPVMEFYTYISYLRYKQAKEEQKLREFRLKNRLK